MVQTIARILLVFSLLLAGCDAITSSEEPQAEPKQQTEQTWPQIYMDNTSGGGSGGTSSGSGPPPGDDG